MKVVAMYSMCLGENILLAVSDKDRENANNVNDNYTEFDYTNRQWPLL